MNDSLRSRAAATDFSSLEQVLRSLQHACDLESLLQSHFPCLLSQIRKNASQPGLLKLWGASSNIDENTGTAIVAPPVLEGLCSLTDLKLDYPICHAGVLHTYGYLLSVIKTPYGFKRERWASGEIASLLGLPQPVLGPCPSQGTLLANATYCLGRMAFRGKRKEVASLRRLRDTVAPRLLEYRYNALAWTRIVESVRLGRKKTINLYTDLVPSQLPGDERCLLIYWVESRQDQESMMGSRLITAFPMAAEGTRELLTPSRFGRGVEIRTRYNACIPELSGKIVAGERQKVRCSAAGITPG